VKRREFITLLSGAASWPLAARAQQVRRVAVFMDLAESDPEGQARVAALKRGLQDLGWVEGRSLRIEQRWARGEAARMKPLAEEIVSLAPEVIVSSGGPTLAALQQATRVIPLVFGGVLDPVAAGFVDSLSRPGGNITGFSNFEFAMGGEMAWHAAGDSPGHRSNSRSARFWIASGCGWHAGGHPGGHAELRSAPDYCFGT
jgi:putative ABC transport system substrate-binding protein